MPNPAQATTTPPPARRAISSAASAPLSSMAGSASPELATLNPAARMTAPPPAVTLGNCSTACWIAVEIRSIKDDPPSATHVARDDRMERGQPLDTGADVAPAGSLADVEHHHGNERRIGTVHSIRLGEPRCEHLGQPNREAARFGRPDGLRRHHVHGQGQVFAKQGQTIAVEPGQQIGAKHHQDPDDRAGVTERHRNRDRRFGRSRPFDDRLSAVERSERKLPCLALDLGRPGTEIRDHDRRRAGRLRGLEPTWSPVHGQCFRPGRRPSPRSWDRAGARASDVHSPGLDTPGPGPADP